MFAIFGYISALFVVLSSIPYIIDILRKKTKPHRVTWLIYTVLSSIAFFSQLAKGATDSLWLSGFITIDVTLCFLLSLKYGVGGVAKKDIVVFLFAALGLVAWYLTNEAAIALYIVILIDMAGSYLTLEKAYKQPETETFIMWFFSAIAAFFAMLAVGSLNIILLSYPLAILLIDGSIATAILLGKRKLNSLKASIAAAK